MKGDGTYIMLYYELLSECYACIYEGNIEKEKAFMGKLFDVNKSELTNAQMNYVMNKMDICISAYYSSLAEVSFYSSLNNNERASVSNINKICLYVRYVKDKKKKCQFCTAMMRTINHCKNRYLNNTISTLLQNVEFTQQFCI